MLMPPELPAEGLSVNPRAIAATAIGLLLLASCTVPSAGPLPAAPTPTVTITVTASPTATTEPSEEPTDDEAGELTGSAYQDAGEKSRDQHTWEEDATRWGVVGDLIDKSSKSGKPVKARFSAVVRSASYNSSGMVTRLSFDRVEHNPNFTDGGNEDIDLNPTVKWETLTAGDLLVLVNPGDGLHQVPMKDFPSFVKSEVAAAKEAGDGWLTPFVVYFIGDTPVALIEWYVP
jgi:hypothetical protein